MYIAISGMSGSVDMEDLEMTAMTLFVYGDQFRSELLATCKIEIHARPVVYMRAQMKSKY